MKIYFIISTLTEMTGGKEVGKKMERAKESGSGERERERERERQMTCDNFHHER